MCIDNSSGFEGEKGLKQWECVLVGHHSNAGRKIEEFESKDWEASYVFCCAVAWV